MSNRGFELVWLDGALAVCRLSAGEAAPGWATSGAFASVTRTADELSVVCDEGAVPEGVRADRGWRAFQLVGTWDFSAVGVLAALAAPLAEAGISLFAISTFDTDYVLVRAADAGRAAAALREAGHSVEDFRA